MKLQGIYILYVQATATSETDGILSFHKLLTSVGYWFSESEIIGNDRNNPVPTAFNPFCTETWEKNYYLYDFAPTNNHKHLVIGCDV